MADSLRVLLVDEDPDVVAVTREFLQREDPALDVESATRTADAIDRVASASFDAVVSDYEMPAMTGVDLAAELRERAPDLPLILYTAHERTAFEAALAGPLSGHVRKGTGHDQYAELAALIRDLA